jgi:uncharacterized membrane protein
MISSFIVAFLGYALAAIVAILDKFILTSEVKKPAVYAFFSTVLFAVVFILLPWSGSIHLKDFGWVFTSGMAFGFGIWTMFIALKHGEASHITPFIGAVVAISTFLLSYLILGESLNYLSKLGILVLVCATLLLSFEKSRSREALYKGFVWATVSGILFGLSHVSAKYIYGLYPFITSLMWTKGTTALVGLIALFSPGVIHEIRNNKKTEKSKTQNKIGIIFSSKVLGAISLVLIQYSIALGSVTIINALAGIQYALMFIFIYLLTRFYPKLFKEYFTRRELLVESGSIILMVIGLFLIS